MSFVMKNPRSSGQMIVNYLTKLNYGLIIQNVVYALEYEVILKFFMF